MAVGGGRRDGPAAPGRSGQDGSRNAGHRQKTASTSMPTGIRSELAVTTTVRAASTRRPVVCLPRSRPTACPTLSDRHGDHAEDTAIQPCATAQAAMSPVP